MIYFGRLSNGVIKIGFTEDLNRRVRELKISIGGSIVVLATMPGDRLREYRIHWRFAELRQRSRLGTELFRPGLDLALYIADLRATAAAEDAAKAKVCCARVKTIADDAKACADRTANRVTGELRYGLGYLADEVERLAALATEAERRTSYLRMAAAHATVEAEAVRKAVYLVACKASGAAEAEEAAISWLSKADAEHRVCFGRAPWHTVPRW